MVRQVLERVLELDGRIPLVDQANRLIPQVLRCIAVPRNGPDNLLLALDRHDVRTEEPLGTDGQHAIESAQVVVRQPRLGAADRVHVRNPGEELVGDDHHVELWDVDPEL